MKIKRTLRTLAIIFILGSNIGCDQISKHVVRQNIQLHEHISVVNGYVTLTKVENKGAFLSAGSSLPKPLKTFVLVFLPLLVLGLSLFYVLSRSSLSTLTIFGICSVIGGGIANIYDRIRYGSVTDFMHIDFQIFQTGIFNMADVSIMFGMFLIIVETFVKEKPIIIEANGKS